MSNMTLAQIEEKAIADEIAKQEKQAADDVMVAKDAEAVKDLLDESNDKEMQSDIVLTNQPKEKPPVSGKVYYAVKNLNTSDGEFLRNSEVHESHTDFEHLMKKGLLKNVL